MNVNLNCTEKKVYLDKNLFQEDTYSEQLKIYPGQLHYPPFHLYFLK